MELPSFSFREFYRGFEKRKYLTYHGRWQLSTLVMLLPMTVLDIFNLPVQLNLVATQFIGACIFWSIDKRIFND
ncbi:MAG: hypothetical protein ACLFTA_02375 [Candidatus Nanohaloarchaea archaeon]